MREVLRPVVPAPRDANVRRVMSAQRSRDTAPEMVLRRALHALGFRYRVDLPLPGMRRRRQHLEPDSIDLLDVGGDILAQGDEPTLRSPLADALTPRAANSTSPCVSWSPAPASMADLRALLLSSHPEQYQAPLWHIPSGAAQF
ncbi:DNA mismatch endonuclease Vsr [Streptomyces sp. 2112.3]|nr:DNA mismatch endonuclease Vsr [Streptomyces sp. 2112.3]